MDEEQWLASTDPTPMLEFLRGKASERKLRLFAVACCRRVWAHLSREPLRMAVEAAECFADGQLGEELLAAAWDAATRVCTTSHATGSDNFAEATCQAAYPDGRHLDTRALLAARFAQHGLAPTDQQQERIVQASLLRCIFGPLAFRLVTIRPALSILGMATAIYEERAWGRLPILADALEELGAPPEAVAHCRLDTVHSRGCHVVDAILGKR